MSQRAYCEFTCDGCGEVVKKDYDHNPQSTPRLPNGWRSVVIECEARRDACEQCLARVRSVFPG